MALNQKPKDVEFWFSIGSTYTYLAVMRLDRVEQEFGVRFIWRPFGLRPITREIGNVPFTGKPVKAAYMWRDIERRAALYGIPFSGVPPYPLQEFDLANRVAVLGAAEGWCKDYVRVTYRRWFLEHQEPGMEPNLSDSLSEIGQDPDRVISLAQSDEIGTAYAQVIDAARAHGIFGSPNLLVGNELFWGDDRVQDAVSWAMHGEVRALHL